MRGIRVSTLYITDHGNEGYKGLCREASDKPMIKNNPIWLRASRQSYIGCRNFLSYGRKNKQNFPFLCFTGYYIDNALECREKYLLLVNFLKIIKLFLQEFCLRFLSSIIDSYLGGYRRGR